MAKNSQVLKLAMAQQRSPKSLGYSKYFAKVADRQTLTQRGFVQHMVDHGLSYPRAVIDGVLTQIIQCLPELVGHGVAVKLDGLGTFYPTIENKKNGVSYSELKAGGIDPNEVVKGVHVRFQPEDSELDKITSRKFKEDCSLELTYVVGGESVTRGTGADATTEFVPNLVAYDAWQKLPAENDGPVGS